MTTSDPHVLWGVIVASASAYLLCALLIKHLLDAHSGSESPADGGSAPSAQHARPPVPDETAPITTVQSARARHRKG
ncbi:hypothetical protein GTY23_23115 [Streptomyces sp. SID5998]|nr:hypothetical protein [Streptomyces sp. SID5998]